MAKKRFFWGTPVMALVLSFWLVLAGCGSSPKASPQSATPDLTGTWVASLFMEVIFDDTYSGNMRVYNDTGESEVESAVKYSWKDSTVALQNGKELPAKLEGDVFTIAGLMDEPIKLWKVSNTNIREGKWKYASDDDGYQILIFNADGSASWKRYTADGTENGSGTFTYKPFGNVAEMKVVLPELGGWGGVVSDISFRLFKDDFNKLIFTNAVIGSVEMVFERQ